MIGYIEFILYAWQVFKADPRSQQQQIDDLLMEIADEVEIDSHGADPAVDVEDKLSALQKGAKTGVVMWFRNGNFSV